MWFAEHGTIVAMNAESLKIRVSGFVDEASARALCVTRYAVDMEDTACRLAATLDARMRAALPSAVWARVVLLISKFHRDLAQRDADERGVWLALAAQCEGEWERRACGAWELVMATPARYQLSTVMRAPVFCGTV